jgi:hypothetical protein
MPCTLTTDNGTLMQGCQHTHKKEAVLCTNAVQRGSLLDAHAAVTVLLSTEVCPLKTQALDARTDLPLLELRVMLDAVQMYSCTCLRTASGRCRFD